MTNRRTLIIKLLASGITGDLQKRYWQDCKLKALSIAWKETYAGSTNDLTNGVHLICYKICQIIKLKVTAKSTM